MTSGPNAPRTLRLAYLTSCYPATSHTFIAREVAALRGLGLKLDTFSIRSPSAEEMKDAAIQSDASTTFTVLSRPWTELIAAQFQMVLGSPVASCRAFALALRHRPPGLKGLALSIAHFAEALVLARELRRRGITHLHNHFANSAATVGYLATRMLKLPWSFTMHGISETDYPAGLLIGRKIEAATFVACASFFIRAQAMRLIEPRHWRKLHVVRCALRLDELPPHSGAADEKVRMICVGRLSPEKGQTGLLEAFASITADQPDVDLLIVGDGPDFEQLRAVARTLDLDDRVTFAGRLGERPTIEEIARSDILVLPSFMEGLPVVLMEAIAVGTPVIASRVAGIPELIRDDENGLLFTPSDWGELAGCIRRLASDKALRRRFASNGRQRLASEFESRVSAERLWQLFQSSSPS